MGPGPAFVLARRWWRGPATVVFVEPPAAQFAPLTGVGKPAVAAYAAQAGLSVEEFLTTRPFRPLTLEIAGVAIVELVQAEAANLAPSYMLHGGGLHKPP